VIIDWAMAAVSGVLGGLLSLVPTWTGGNVLDPAQYAAAGVKIGSAVGLVNHYFPVAILGACLVLVLAVKTFGSVWDVIVWLYRMLPFKAS